MKKISREADRRDSFPPFLQTSSYDRFKRAFDVSFSVVFLVSVMSWLTPLVALAILLDSPGPVFFVQRRVGKNGKLFPCLKFRTMILNDVANELQASNDDRRITFVGRLLRRTNIDEFPQFFNVLIGDMSVVGPRPHMPSDYTRFSFVIPSYHLRTVVQPGITGLAQVKSLQGPALNHEAIYMRYHWDAEYIRHAAFALDLKITVITMLRGLANLVFAAGALVTGR